MRKDRYPAGVSLLAALLLSGVCAAAVYGSIGFVYAIADDVIMRDIASGAFTGTPDGHLIFIQYVLGFLISRLYLWQSHIDWYGFFMAGSLFLGLAVILYRGLAAKKSLVWKTVYVLLVLGLFGTGMVFHAAQFEWTISAAMLGASALYLYATVSECGKGQRMLEGVLIWLLLLLTFCIRYDVFFMVLPGFGIAFLCRVGASRSPGKSFLRQLFLPAAVFLAVGAVALVEQEAYRGQDWEEFQTFQTARSEVYDYSGVPSYEADPAFFEELGLSEHEVRNLRHYALYLVDGMDAQMMERLSEEAKLQTRTEGGLKAELKSAVSLAVSQLREKEYFPVTLPALVMLIAVLVMAFRRKKPILIPVFGFLAAEGVLWLALGFLGRLPERVAFSMHLVALLGLAAVAYRLFTEEQGGREVQKRTATKGTRLVLVLTALSLVWAGFQWNAARSSNEEKLSMDENYQLFKAACKDESDSLYFIETYMAEPVGGAAVTADGDFRLNRCLTLGDWYTTSPLDQERLEALGIGNVEETLLTNSNAYLVVRDTQDTGFLGTYFAYKYPGSSLICRDVKVIEERSYYLYQVELPEGEQ